MMTVGPGETRMPGWLSSPWLISLIELVVDDADHLLAGLERLEHLLALGLLNDVLGELLDDLVWTSASKGANVLHGLAYVGFGNGAAAAEFLDRGVEAVGRRSNMGLEFLAAGKTKTGLDRAGCRV